jgi:hypothetical protein
MESGQRSRESEQAVTLLGEAMQRLAGRNGGEDGNTVANDMRKSIGDLHSAGEIAFSRSMEIATLAQRIASDLRSSLESFSAARSFSETIARCRSVLDRFSEGADTTGETGGEKPGGLVDFASHYTMASERETHAEIVGGGDDAAAVAAIAGSDLGENVELF